MSKSTLPQSEEKITVPLERWLELIALEGRVKQASWYFGAGMQMLRLDEKPDVAETADAARRVA